MTKTLSTALAAFFILGPLAACRPEPAPGPAKEAKAAAWQPISTVPAETAEAGRWFGAKFLGTLDKAPESGALLVSLKSGAISRNAVAGRPLRIVNQGYSRGLNLPSVGTITVHLPAPARTFEAVVGVDSNDVTYYSNLGRGAVIAVVEAGGKELFRSGILREGIPGAPVKVELSGASELTLRLNAAGSGDEWDQADWAEARVTLADGRTLWLDELPQGPLAASPSAEPPFSFRLAGRPFKELVTKWKVERSVVQLDPARAQTTLTYTDPASGLVVRAVAVTYSDFPAVEWTLYFKNPRPSPSRIIEDIQALDLRLERNGDPEFILHHSRGSAYSTTDYQPIDTKLGPKAETRLSAAGGRPTNSDLCYFNVEWPGQGLIIALGWPGQWAARFTRDEAAGLQVRAGQELTHFKLLPGEEVRSPLVALLFWKGDWLRSQNLWRRWMVAHNLPRPGGKLPPPQFAAMANRQYMEMQEATEQNQKESLARYLADGFKPDYYWMDAGWYTFNKGWWETGTWEPDPKRFPRGLRAVSDAAHAQGVKTIVWFEPERVAPGTWLYEKHPEWLLGRNGQDKLFFLGNAEARRWLTDHIDTLLTEQGIDLYRQDHNFDPLAIWRAADAADRQGITEIGHATGYLAYWDELRRRHPNMLIDSCASGGRRNDLETLRRAVPLWRDDFVFEPTPMQNFTVGAALWIPYFGTGVRDVDAYSFRSQLTPAIAFGVDIRRPGIDFAELRTLVDQWRAISDDYYGDFYPLTAWSAQDDVWCAWQFDRPEAGTGTVQVFRRPLCPYEAARFKLRGLDPEARYRVTNLDGPGDVELTGTQLMGEGLPVTLKAAPQSAIIVYKRTGPGASR